MSEEHDLKNGASLAGSGTPHARGLSIALWIVQSVLGLMFVGTGFWKALTRLATGKQSLEDRLASLELEGLLRGTLASAIATARSGVLRSGF